ncbi:hypothetical protein F8M41_001780 [Gigaspora margarita]|uniref:Uncharacterized protein n=1 Tax=Gigaspora margarita TaxID=4874 RepID=A0A8H3XEN0_GIGMA|nr:hypothetical protein F8M41_001780 [Gigaspora margarita]
MEYEIMVQNYLAETVYNEWKISNLQELNSDSIDANDAYELKEVTTAGRIADDFDDMNSYLLSQEEALSLALDEQPQQQQQQQQQQPLEQPPKIPYSVFEMDTYFVIVLRAHVVTDRVDMIIEPDHLQIIIKGLMQPIRNNYGKVVQAEWPDNFEVKLNFPSAIKTDVNDVIVKMEGDTSILTINKAQKILKLKVVDNK